MDSTLKRFTDGARGDPTIRLTFLIDGVLVMGAIAHPSRLEDKLTEGLEKLAADNADENEAAQLRGYAFNERLDKHPDEAEYLTLADVTLIFATAQTLNIPVMRVRTDAVTAWWSETDGPDDAASEDAEDDATVDFQID